MISYAEWVMIRVAAFKANNIIERSAGHDSTDYKKFMTTTVHVTTGTKVPERTAMNDSSLLDGIKQTCMEVPDTD